MENLLLTEYNSLIHARVISQFNKDLAQLSEADCGGIIKAAKAYNEKLMNNPRRFYPTDSETAEYHKILDFTGTGVIGALEIYAINVRLPIYLGTDKQTLKKGAGHLEGSYLPVGGLGTHSIICVHRGFPTSTLLLNADRLVIGDTFTLKILNEILTYKIDHIAVVDPYDYKYLDIPQNSKSQEVEKTKRQD